MKLIIFLTLLLFAQSWLFGQNNCIHEVSTDPDDPFNSSLPSTDDYPNGDPRFINTFDWYRNYNIPLYNFLPIYPTDMTKLDFDSHSYYTFLSSGEDLTPENGWELMLFNTGYYPDQSEVTGLGAQDLPYIAIYNRFTGILRVFGSYGVSPVVNGGVSFDGLRITLKFGHPTKLSGNLRLRNGHDASLDQNTDVILTQTLALHTNSPSQWFCADFQLAYDPCICYYPSQLRLQFDFYESKEITLYGRSITVEDEIADGNNLLTNNFLSNFQNTAVDAQGNFTTDDQVIMYKVMSDFVDDYIAKLEKYKAELAQVQEYNKEIERKLVIVKIFKDVVINGATYGISSFIGQNWFQDAVDFADDFIPPLNSDSSAIAGYRKKLEAEAKKAIGSGVEMFIDKNFKKKKEPTKPDAPVANFTETKMTGKLTELTSIEKSAFYAPGTYGSEGTGSPILNNPIAYPIFNNAVGVFALLNEPKIKAYKSDGEIYSDQGGVFTRYTSWNRNYQFKLDNDLYYAINDLDLNSHEISVSFEVEGEIQRLSSDIATLPSGGNQFGQLSSYVDYLNSINVSSTEVNNDEYYPIKVSDGKGFNDGANYCGGLTLDYGFCQYEAFDLPNNTYSKNRLTFSTDYFPLDAISPVIFSAGIMNQYFQGAIYTVSDTIDPSVHGWTLENIGVKMKLIVDVVYNQFDENGENITETLMFTYDVDDIEWVTSPIETDLQNSSVNFTGYDENLILNTTVFDGSPVEGCKLVGTHYTCHGWDDVTIVGDLTTSGGHTVDILGANNVFVIGESNISPEIVLDIQTLLDYSDPMPRADALFVEKFCKNNLGEGFPAYEANKPNKNALEEYEAFNSDKPNETSNFELLSVNLYPVPANNLLNLHSSIALSNEKITILDLSGRILDFPIRKVNDQDFEINVAQLAVGSYYLTISSNEGQAKKLFMIAKNN